MRPKVSVFIAVSSDGFIARPNGAIDWLRGDASAEYEDVGYNAFIATVDALIMGRNTFEKVLSFDAWPHEKTPVTVLSASLTPQKIPPSLSGKVAISAKAPAVLLKEMAANGNKHVYVDGGKTIQIFLRSGLVDEMILSRLPVLIGEGIPLFGVLASGDIHLKHISTKTFSNGLVQTHYRIPTGR